MEILEEREGVAEAAVALPSRCGVVSRNEHQVVAGAGYTGVHRDVVND